MEQLKDTPLIEDLLNNTNILFFMEELINDQYMSVFEKNKILNLSWKENTSNFTDEDFKEEALKFISVVKKQNGKKIIVDMRKFSYNLSDDLIAWRNKNIISVYNEIKVEKFAFISDKPTINQDNPNNTFVTKSFTSEQEADDWINS